MQGRSVLFFLLIVTTFVSASGCAGVNKGRPNEPGYQDPVVNGLMEKYSKPDAIPADQSKMTESQRNQIMDELIFLTDVNYNKFEMELYQGRALFDTTTDLAILGLGAAGGLITHSATQGIISAISGGIAGSRVSINKNYFHDSSTHALIAKMQAARRAKLASIREAMSTDMKQYSLAHGLSDVGDYYNVGTVIGALQEIVADAGQQKKQADQDLKAVLDIRRDKSFLEKSNVARIGTISKKIKALGDVEAIALNQNPPTQDPNAEKVVREQDAGNQRFVKGDAARQALLLRASYDTRTEQNLSAWEKALQLQ